MNLRKLINRHLLKTLGRGYHLRSNDSGRIGLHSRYYRKTGPCPGGIGCQAVAVFHCLDPDIQVSVFAKDGDKIIAGMEIAKLSGGTRALLAGERVALNLLQHLSGIATLTTNYLVTSAGRSRLGCWTREKHDPGDEATRKICNTRRRR